MSAVMVQGLCDPAFERVRTVFAELAEAEPAGLAVCIEIAGQPVVDLWAGAQDREGSLPWRQDTLVNLFSCTKIFAAVAALQLVAEGALDLDVPVAQYWPEFAEAGKAEVSLRHLLAHRSGVNALRDPLPPEALFDWDGMVQALAAEAPWWVPGTAHGYAPVTYGWLVGEVLQRVTRHLPRECLATRTAQPLGLDFSLGVADTELARVAHIHRRRNDWGDADAQRLMGAFGQDGLTALAFANPPSVLTATNRPEWRHMQQPAMNGYGTARTLSGFYTGLLQGKLLPQALLEELCREQAAGPDPVLLTTTRFGLGCMLDQPDLQLGHYGLGARAFGHPGAGGCLGFADPDAGVAFGFVTNCLGPYVLLDPRPVTLVQALCDCL